MYSEEALDPPSRKDVHAWGSLDEYTLCALDCGKSAYEAVEMTARRDPYTNIDHGITVFDLVDWKFIE
jgi:hypothetical protein